MIFLAFLALREFGERKLPTWEKIELWYSSVDKFVIGDDVTAAVMGHAGPDVRKVVEDWAGKNKKYARAVGS